MRVFDDPRLETILTRLEIVVHSLLCSAYDHEHGARASALMNYEPKYGLTEHKNGRGVESNHGFKDFVFEQGNVMVYLSVHAQTSKMRRVDHHFHTVTMAMKQKDSGELLADISFKADFGFLAARKRGSGEQFIPLSSDGLNMSKQQRRGKPYRRAFRTINVVNQRSLDYRFQYNYQPRAGTYEEWVCTLPCTETDMNGELVFDIQDPITGIKSSYDKSTVWLGRRYRDGKFRPNLGMKRTVRARNLRLSASFCKFGEGFEGGYFYTDPYGKELLDGPGPNAVRQFIKPGFVGTMSGKFSPGEQWRGMHYADKEQMFFLPHGYGINRYVN